MGVPKFASWLIKKYNKENIVFQKEKLGLEPIDWFLIDSNCLFHPTCFRVLAEEDNKNEKVNFKSLQNKMIKSIINYMEKLIKYTDPQKGIFISIDGPVCYAKIKQQRQRRFRSVYDKVFFDKLKIKYNVKIPYYWNNSAISPGTKFMNKLHNNIIEWLKDFKKQNKNIQIIYSSANVPGEGEHKLLDFIKENNTKKLDLSYVTYGLDADLIFLMLVTKLDRVYLLREAQQFESKALVDQLNFVSIKTMKICIYDTFFKQINDIKIDKIRINNDFVFLCYLLGNDFLPHILALDITRNGIEYIISKYCETFTDKQNYILSNDTKSIDQDFITLFFSKLANDENMILINNFSKKRKPKYQGFDEYEKNMFKIENILFNVTDPIGICKNSDYRERYYKHYFDVDNDELEEFVKKLVKHYLIGMKWVTVYYFNKISDWTWYYTYDYPPFISDISKYLININDIRLDDNEPITPLEQLLVILPAKSKYLLPDCFGKLTNSIQSSLIYLYPTDFKIDFLYKHRYWEGIPLLPPLEIKLVRHIYNKYKDELTIEEQHRNRLDTNLILY